MVRLTPAQAQRLRGRLDQIGLLAWHRLETSPRLGLALMAGRVLGWDLSSSALIGNVALASLSDESLAVLAWWVVNELLEAGVELSETPTPAELASTWAELGVDPTA